MLLNPIAVLLASGVAASAKLWNWPDQFSISVRNTLGEHDMNKGRTFMQACSGWGTWCDPSRCWELQQMDVNPTDGKNPFHNFNEVYRHAKFDWAHIRRENADWIDLWLREDGSFGLYKNNSPDAPYGFCERPRDGGRFGGWENCGGRHVSDAAFVSLRCYQY